MKERSLIVLLLCLVAGCAADGPRSVEALRAAPLYTFDEREVDAYLGWLARQEMTTSERVVHLARKNIGQPYRMGLLGEYPFELHDADPMYCLSASDCVTFVEQTYAMALSDCWASFFQFLQRIRYRDGIIGIATRNHYTEADWNPNNAWLFKDITASLSGEKPAAMRVRIDRQQLLARHGVFVLEPVEILVDAYIPREQIADMVMALHDADVVEVVRGDEAWQYVSHMGLIVLSDAGEANIIHATGSAVREEPLLTYMARNRDVKGFKFLRRIDTTMMSIAALSGDGGF